MATMIDLAELQQGLDGFHGTQDYHRWSSLFSRHVLTDGCEWLAENAGAYWLMDAIASHFRKYRSESFVSVTLKKCKTGGKWALTIDDGNGRVLEKQLIEFSDFPLPEIQLFVARQENLWVIMLPSEY